MSVAEVLIVAPSRSYPVLIGSGILRERLAKAASELVDAERAAIITDTGVPQRWVEEVCRGIKDAGIEVSIFVFEQGESSKTIGTCSELLSAMADSGLHRRDVVVGVGGGVTTDIAGFLASIYMRGVELFQVPTTLLGMVDAAIGGKTGVNLQGWKNLVGSFYQPAVVICDLSTLETLPIEELRTGMAEVIKYGFISRPEILELAASLRSRLVDDHREIFRYEEAVEVVRSCVEVKASVVSSDERESGIREILNFGHTLGHAIERVTLHKVSHGEAISIGMAFEAELSALLLGIDPSVVTEVRGRIAEMGLPVSVGGVEHRVAKESVFEAMAMDKKYLGGMRFVLLESIGNPIVRMIDDSTKIDIALARVGIQ